MTIYHLVPRTELLRHRFDDDCKCKPNVVLKGERWWLARFLGKLICQHNFFKAPKKRNDADDYAAVGGVTNIA